MKKQNENLTDVPIALYISSFVSSQISVFTQVFQTTMMDLYSIQAFIVISVLMLKGGNISW